MKKTLAVIFCFMLVFTCASAHPGRTDSNGGHWDHSTGEYHYHHGYEAHQHPNGICPYDYNDLTGSTSGSSSASSSVSANTVSVPYEGDPGDYGPEAEWEFETKRDAHYSGFEWGVEYSHNRDNPDSAFSEGYNEGYEQGYSEGETVGYEDGREYGYQEGTESSDESYDQGYNDGIEYGENHGYSTGYNDAECKYQWIIMIAGSIAIAIICLLVHSLRKVNGEFSQYQKQHEALRKSYNEQRNIFDDERRKCNQAIQSRNLQIQNLQSQIAKLKAAPPTHDITFGNWSPAVHQNETQFKRFQNSLDPRLKFIGKAGNFYKVQGTTGIYDVTLNSCNCKDFLTNLHGQSPCKHIYFLARQCGIPVNSIFKDFPSDPK